MPHSHRPAPRRAFALGLLVLAGLTGLAGCGSAAPPAEQGPATPVGVLLVAHGSGSSTWTHALEDFAAAMRPTVLARPGVKELRLAFLDEPKSGVATAMKGFDAAGIREVVVVPLFVSAESTMTNDYLQYLIGMRSEQRVLNRLQSEGYEIYFPRARATITPALSGSEVLKRNVLRRVEALRGTDSGEKLGVLLVGYGDKVYGQQMEEIMQGIGRYLKIQTPMDAIAYAFCGNLVEYSGEPVAKALHELLETKEQVIVVPVLLAVDEKLQENAIRAAINAIDTPKRVRYAGDAILPDAAVGAWAIERVDEALQRVRDAGGRTVPAPTRG